jgi:uncharacterized membrane protein
MRSLLSAVVLLALTVIVSADSSGRATITESSTTVSKGTITIDAPPADVYALMTDYAAWRKVLTDIVSVKVESGGRRDARVRMESRALEHKVTVAFDNDPDRAIRFKLVDGPRGARATGEYLLVGIDGGKRTRIDATLYMDVVGAVGLFVTNKKIRNMRQAKLRTDLEDLARWMRLHQRAATNP